MVNCRQDPTYSEGVTSRGVKTILHVFQETSFCSNTSGYFPLKNFFETSHKSLPRTLSLYILHVCKGVCQMYQYIMLSFAETKIYSFFSPESYKTSQPCLSYDCCTFLKPGRDTQASVGLSCTHLHTGHVGLLPAKTLLEDVLLSEDEATLNPARIRGNSSSKPLVFPSLR